MMLVFCTWALTPVFVGVEFSKGEGAGQKPRPHNPFGI